MATQPSSTIRPTARSGVFSGERKPRSTRYRTSARTGQKKEVQKKIFNGDRCAKESPIYIAGPRYHSAASPQTEYVYGRRSPVVLSCRWFPITETKAQDWRTFMEKFINKYREQILGTLSGFDRLVFRGSLRRLNYGRWDQKLEAMVVAGMEQYLSCNHVLFKEYLDHVKGVSQKVKQASVRAFEEQGLPVRFLRDPSADKEEIARAIASARKLESGLVCALSSMEISPSFEHRGTHMVRRLKPCQVIYQYQIHPEVGWMYARIQTWFPFNIQVGLNGREWLARQMGREGLKYRQQGNGFVWIEDYAQAQKLMDRELEINWTELLKNFAGQ